jgi:predicted nucleic acid-binding protein
LIAADTSTWIAFLDGGSGDDVALLDAALRDRQLLMPPVVLTELLSDPGISQEAAEFLRELPLIEITAGFWERAGRLRADVLRRKRKARLGDALIAQSCVDREIPLLTRDRDFRAFATSAGLDLAVAHQSQVSG